MEMTSEDIAAMVFRRSTRSDLGEFSMDSKMLTILMSLDGQKNLGNVSMETGIDLNSMRSIISKLLKLQLILPVENVSEVLDKDFLSYLQNQLSQAVGPIAKILIEDAASDLGFSTSTFPVKKVAELVEFLSREIQRKDKIITFKQNIIKKIKQKGY